MSVSLARVEKSPKPAIDHSRPTWPIGRRKRDGVVGDVVDLELSGIAVAHQHVGLVRHEPEKSPNPETVHSRPTCPTTTLPVMLLLLTS